MIRLSGLVNLQALKEQDQPEPEQAPAEVKPTAEPEDKDVMVQKLTKLQSMELSPEQQKKVEDMLLKVQELTGDQEKLDVDGDGEIEASDLQKLRDEEPTDEEVVLENDDELTESHTDWEKTVLAAQKSKELDNPWSVSNWAKKKGCQPTNESMNELSPATLKSYKDKASVSKKKAHSTIRNAEYSGDEGPHVDKAYNTAEKRQKGIANAERSTVKVKNPSTGEDILAMTAYKAGSSHPAYNAAKSALGRILS